MAEFVGMIIGAVWCIGLILPFLIAIWVLTKLH